MKDQIHDHNNETDQEINGDGQDLPRSRNIMRDRTFNEDLRNLLVKIDKYEKSVISQEDVSSVNLHDLTIEQLLYQFHSLFYHVKYSGDSNDSNEFFNPFEIDMADKDEVLFRITDQLYKTLQHNGFNSFCILYYSNEMKCYMPLHNRIHFIKSDGFVISLRDSFFKNLAADPFGVLIGKDELANDEYFNKKISRNGTEPITPLFCIFMDKMTGGIYNEILRKSQYEERGFHQSLILIIQCDNSITHADKEPIYRRLMDSCAFPVLLYKIHNPYKDNIGDSHLPFFLIEYFAGISFNSKDSFSVSLKCKRREFMFFFIIRYLIEKFRRILPDNNAVLQISTVSFIIFTDNPGIQIIENTIAQINSIFSDAFHLYIMRNSEYHQPHELVKELFFGL